MTTSAITLVAGLLRATAFVSFSALLLPGLLTKLRVSSPRLHRFAWCMVVFQGWWFVAPCTLQLAVRDAVPVVQGDSTETISSVPSSSDMTRQTIEAADASGEPATDDFLMHRCGGVSPGPPAVGWSMLGLATVALIWVGGFVGMFAYHGLIYIRFVRHVPLGERPEREWAAEWDTLRRESRIRRTVKFRITENLGPVLCFVPFCHYVLAPQRLWTALSRPQRLAILRHELAHFLRGDIWKSAAMRVLVLPQWFNPLAWRAVRKFDQCGEWACDDWAKGINEEQNLSYAQTLLRLGEAVLVRSPYGAAAHGGVLSTRVQRILTAKVKEDSVMKKMLLFVVLFGVSATQLVRVELVAQEEPGHSRVLKRSEPRRSASIDGKVYSCTYDVADLIRPVSDPKAKPTAASFRPLIAEITSTVAADTWNNKGGTRSITPWVTNLSLVVAQTPSVHRQVAQLLKTKRETLKRETLKRVGLNPYRIEPPDILLIQEVRMAPKSPYYIQALDIIQIIASGTLPEDPIAGTFQVEPNGTVNLGPSHGTIKIVGKTTQEAADVIKEHLKRQGLNVLQVAMSLLQPSGRQAVLGEHLVGPDGSISLGKLGNVYVAGKTVKEATKAVEELLSATLEDPVVSLNVFAYNSKFCYIVMQRAGPGDNVFRIPITGNETVLDALAQVQRVQRISDTKKIWIARPAPKGATCHQVLPVDLAAITKRNSTATNYQLYPGDRLYIRATADDVEGQDLRESPPADSVKEKGLNSNGLRPTRTTASGRKTATVRDRMLPHSTATVVIESHVFYFHVQDGTVGDVLSRTLPQLDSDIDGIRFGIVDPAITARTVCADLEKEGTVQLQGKPVVMTESERSASVLLAKEACDWPSCNAKSTRTIEMEYTPMTLKNGSIRLEFRPEISRIIRAKDRQLRCSRNWHVDAVAELTPGQSLILAFLKESDPIQSSNPDSINERSDSRAATLIVVTPKRAPPACPRYR